MHVAIFPCIGLGDGLISCILAKNLREAGHQVTVFHPILPELTPLFPSLSFVARPKDVHELHQYEKGIFFYERLPWMQRAMREFPKEKIILNPIATPKRDYLYWEEGEFDGNLPFVENLVHYVKKKWGYVHATKENGIHLPSHIEKGKHAKRVILHPTSSRASKNWTKEKFLMLAQLLEKKGFEPIFILTKEEKRNWPEIQAPTFPTLCSIAEFIAESGFMIGNDSGIGHLASCLGTPTLTICRSKMGIYFWRPCWAEGKVIFPPRWIPNIKGIRLRDKKWQSFISVKRVYKEFLSLYEASIFSH